MMPLTKKKETFGRTPEGKLVEANLYEDGDLVICHGARGGGKSIRDRDGNEPIFELMDHVGVPVGYEDDIIDFVEENEEIIA